MIHSLPLNKRAALAQACYRGWLQAHISRNAKGKPVLPAVQDRADALVAIRQDLGVQPIRHQRVAS